MRSNVVRILAAGAAVVLAVVLLVVLKDDGGETSDSQSKAVPSASVKPHEEETPAEDAAQQPAKKPAVPTIIVRNGKPVGGIAELSFQAGEDARFKVSSDVSDELHLHGYDISKEIEAGGKVSFDFPAEIEGIFELELEQRAEPIAELQVNP